MIASKWKKHVFKFFRWTPYCYNETISETRQHFGRMRAIRLPTVRVSVATTRCQCCGGGGPQVNKYEQVSSDDHQMSMGGWGAGG